MICNKIQHNRISRKYRICEKGRAKNVQEATIFLADHIYTRIADLNTNERMFKADIYYHVTCFTKYIQRFKTTNASFKNYIRFIDEIISHGNGITPSEIYDMINTNEDTEIKNNEAKIFLEEFFGNSIQFCETDRQNQSSMVFSSPIDITDVINTLWSLHGVKSAAQTQRKACEC